jgi:tetratricopeptide (TPR) repeat protein
LTVSDIKNPINPKEDYQNSEPADVNKPSSTELAVLLENLKKERFAKAESLALSIIQKHPKSLIVWQVLDTIFHQSGRLYEALRAEQMIAKLASSDPMVHKTLGDTFSKLEQFTEAVSSYHRFTILSPDVAEGHFNLGTTLLKLGDPESAQASLKKAIDLNQNYFEAHFNLGHTFKNLNNLDKSVSSFREALRLEPNNAEVYCMLGNVLDGLGDRDQAEAFYLNGLATNPDCPLVHTNLGTLYSNQKKYNKAQRYYQKALEIDPNFADSKWGLSLLYLKLGEFRKGFYLYESRYHKSITENITLSPVTRAPQYQGEDLNSDLKGKHLLIIAEQGIGDEIMFASVLDELRTLVFQNSKTRLTLACDPRLVELLSRSFPFLTVIPKNQNNCYQALDNNLDYWVFMGSLPKFYRQSIADFTHVQPYLSANDLLVRKWTERFNQLPHSTNVGISWSGGSKKKSKKSRSLSLEEMLPVISEVSKFANIINLQYGDHNQEISSFSQTTGITIQDWQDIDPLVDLENFSAQIKCLDLVISIDNSTIHFAGGLGTKSYVLLPYNQDWRWLENQNHSYWYPNILTVFRQPEEGEWDSAIQEVKNILRPHQNIPSPYIE